MGDVESDIRKLGQCGKVIRLNIKVFLAKDIPFGRPKTMPK